MRNEEIYHQDVYIHLKRDDYVNLLELTSFKYDIILANPSIIKKL